MEFEKYRTSSLTIAAVLGLIEGKQIAIPEMQRPFVWKKTQVRDYMDSLYRGYPTGNFTIWKNHDVRLKNGKMSEGKKIIIDGQQRITALMSVIMGNLITLSDYKKGRIKIAFDPFQAFSEKKDSEIFAVQDSSHLKSKRWIPDIAEVFKNDFDSFSFIMKYCEANPDMKHETLNKAIQKLKGIANRTLGLTELSEKLDIDTVTEIFIRINSKGSELSQGDFVMSKIAADENYGGSNLRKAIDYFAHLFRFPTFYNEIKRNDEEFHRTDYFTKMEWLKNINGDIVYCPDYGDLIRVAFMHKCHRAKLSELVSMLSGRDFVTKEYKEEVISDTYTKITVGISDIINEYNFKQFMLAINSAGFISKKLVNSQMALDFAYVLYLNLIESHEVASVAVKHLVQRWYVLSVLTGRYSSSPESAFAKDIRLIHEHGVVAILNDIEAATLSENFWNVAVVQNLMLTSTNNPTYLVYLAAQVMMNDVSLLSKNVSVQHLIDGGEIHHIFPKEYLKAYGHERSSYNQVGNYAHLDSGINKYIGKKAPSVYFSEAKKQCETKQITIGSIVDYDTLLKNLEANCIPEDVFDMDYTRYAEFLEKRRKLMAKKIRKYYESL